jgi:hypothetical protein
MPSQVRIIRERNSGQWDQLVQGIIGSGALRQEQVYFGITNPDRADKVRRGIRTAAKRTGHASRVYYSECPDAGHCALGGNDCAYHVNFTVFTLDEGRQEMASRGQQRANSRR